ncbi:VOC family protein [Streptomyces indicus]|uniref:4a-hydroxytetrahydrobiopterin dehydratase n=1 Tax=Streptomyces indicus TaxID=417292 RepID=A0A1G8ZLE5_9ACTN|nr:VOC family protein [Streptomyces indicus]SDK15939.1 4a-hydroxytetrahydrobiopterin dehydratase [Streptomyces indicus]
MQPVPTPDVQPVPTPDVLAAIADDLGDWRVLAQPLAARYVARDADAAYAAEAGGGGDTRVASRGGDPTVAAAFVSAVAQVAATAGHAVPEIRLAGGAVDLLLYTVAPDGGRWIMPRDLELARLISGLAAKFQLRAVPAEVTQVELALDAADFNASGPFWSALLTGDASNTVHDSVFDPACRVPPLWFQGTDPHETPRQRWHLDVWLAPEVVEARIAAAVAAGGTVVDTSGAPAYTVLADPEDNKVCVACATGRS